MLYLSANYPSFFNRQGIFKIDDGFIANRHITYEVSIRARAFQHRCGGIILDEKTILTAAQCCMLPNQCYVVSAGLIEEQSYPKQSAQIDKFIHHPNFTMIYNDYGENYAVNDYLILKLKQALRFDWNVQPVCLPSTFYQPKIGKVCVMSGYGKESWSMFILICKNIILIDYLISSIIFQ